MTELTPEDLHMVVVNLPRDVQKLLKENRLYVGGGFIRAVISGEKVSDIDMFGHDADYLTLVADKITEKREARSFKTKNAITILSPPRIPLQFIKRWVFDSADKLVASFDYTVCQAAIWYKNKSWHSWIGDRFYSDLAAKRLFYTSPVRDEEAGGSMLRMRKYLKRGYNIQPESMAAVMARVFMAVDRDKAGNEEWAATIIAGLLREVDPLMVVDGVDFVADHETPEGDNEPTEA